MLLYHVVAQRRRQSMEVRPRQRNVSIYLIKEKQVAAHSNGCQCIEGDAETQMTAARFPLDS